jgi:hypothetical protein
VPPQPCFCRSLGALPLNGYPPRSHQSGHALELTLPPVALSVLRDVPRKPGQDCVFGLCGTGFVGWSYSLTTLNLRIAEVEGRPLAPWSLHDLRRTMRSGLGGVGVAPHVAERCIGHLPAGVVERTYDKFRYGQEIAAALRRWAEHVVGIVEGCDNRDNIASLADRAGRVLHTPDRL